jgi:acetylornithine/N-succinyldiaminopimelate aminotransferase
MAQVGLAICRVVSAPGFLETVRERGVQLESRLRQLAQTWGGAAWRGCGLLQALVFEEPVAAELSEAARERGLLVNAARPNVLRFMPQLRISEAELGELGVRLEAAWSAVTADGSPRT